MNGLASTAPHVHDASSFGNLVDWGAQPDPVEGASRSTGRLLHKGPDGAPEVGIWVCTPGIWRLVIPRDEFCHFVAGSALYAHDDGGTLEVGPGTAAMFPSGWTGTCTVQETIRNLYMLV